MATQAAKWAASRRAARANAILDSAQTSATIPGRESSMVPQPRERRPTCNFNH